MLALLLPAIGFWAAIRALIRPAFRSLLFGRRLFWRGALSRSGFGRLVVALALIRARAAPFGAAVIAAGALLFTRLLALLLARLLARLEAGRALLANPRGRRWAELLFIFGVGRDQPEAHGVQHRAKVFALDPQAASQIPRQKRGRLARQVPQFAGDSFRHIQPQQYRPRRQPAHGLGKAARPIGGRRHCNQPARGQLRRFDAAQQGPKLRAQSHGARLQRFRHVKRIAPGTNANALQFLAEIRADFTIRPPQGQAQFLTQPKGRAAQRVILGGFFFRRENRAQIALHQSLNPSG